MTASDFQLLVSDDWSDYQLLDSGDMRKLERFGKVRVNRRPAGALEAQRPGQQLESRRHLCAHKGR